MPDQPVDVELAGENVAGETCATEPEAVTDQRTDHDCMAVFVPNATGQVEDVPVPVRGAVGTDRLAASSRACSVR